MFNLFIILKDLLDFLDPLMTIHELDIELLQPVKARGAAHEAIIDAI
jgi:hypothetical protein